MTSALQYAASPPGEQRTETQLAITGMTCAACVAHVTKALGRIAGVRSVSVILATERATVQHDFGIDSDALMAAVDETGYGTSAIAPDAGQVADDDDALRREREIAGKRRVLIFGVALFVPTAILGMGFPPFAGKDWLLLALSVPAWAIVGWDFHRAALAQARHFSANMDTLVSLGSTAALGLSLEATLTGHPTYYETARSVVSSSKTQPRSNGSAKSIP